MSKCTFIPTNKEGNIPSLFTQLKSYFGNTKQALYYWQRVKSPEFSKTFPNVRYDNEVYINHVFTLQITISFMLMIIGVYYVDFSKLFVFRLIAYYSYNWYLWHTVFAKFISNNFSNQYIGLSLYLFISFAVAVIFTVLIEERFLSYRAMFIDKLFGTDNRKNV